MVEWLWTKDREWYDKWDSFNNSTLRGHYLQLSDWLFSYHNFGFDTELLIGLENGEICIGYGIVKAKFLFFKFYVINCGPIVKEGYEKYLEDAIVLFLEKSRKEGACYCHISLPVLKEGSFPFALPNDVLKNDGIFFSGKIGLPFAFISSSKGFGWIDLPPISEEERLAKFTNPITRKNIRISLRRGLTIVEAATPDQIREAYRAIELNANERGYSIRNWDELKNCLVNLHKKGFAELAMAYKDNECKGAFFFIKVNKRYTEIMGGTKKEYPDIKVGSFLKWHILTKSMKEGLPGYDITIGGSLGVQEFKLSFDPTIIEFIEGRHWVLSQFKYKIYNTLYPFLRRNKRAISSFIKIIKKTK